MSLSSLLSRFFIFFCLCIAPTQSMDNQKNLSDSCVQTCNKLANNLTPWREENVDPNLYFSFLASYASHLEEPSLKNTTDLSNEIIQNIILTKGPLIIAHPDACPYLKFLTHIFLYECKKCEGAKKNKGNSPDKFLNSEELKNITQETLTGIEKISLPDQYNKEKEIFKKYLLG